MPLGIEVYSEGRLIIDINVIRVLKLFFSFENSVAIEQTVKLRLIEDAALSGFIQSWSEIY